MLNNLYSDIKDCSRYKVSEFPAMIYWGGAGFAF